MHKVQVGSLGSVDSRIIWAILLGWVSGFPLLLTGSTLQAWLVSSGYSLKAIGALSLLGWPYLLKVLWAPMLDRPTFGKRAWGKNTWIVLICMLVGGSLAAMAFLEPAHIVGLLIAAAVVAWASATLDAAIDGYRIEILDRKDYGVVAGGGLTASRLAMMVAGGGLLIIADHFSWRSSYEIAAAIMVCVACVCAFLPASPGRGHQPDAPQKTWRQIWSNALKIPMTSQQKIWFLVFVVAFKCGDAFILNLAPAFLLRHCHLSLTYLGMLNKVAGVIATLVGAVFAGVLLRKITLNRIVALTLVLQAISVFCYFALASNSVIPTWTINFTVVFECFSSGMGGTILVTMLMRCCEKSEAATRYAF